MKTDPNVKDDPNAMDIVDDGGDAGTAPGSETSPKQAVAHCMYLSINIQLYD